MICRHDENYMCDFIPAKYDPWMCKFCIEDEFSYAIQFKAGDKLEVESKKQQLVKGLVDRVDQVIQELEGEGRIEEQNSKFSLTEKLRLSLDKEVVVAYEKIVKNFPCPKCEHNDSPINQEPCLSCPKIRGSLK